MGPQFEFDWTINADDRNIPLADYHPGDAFVDIISIDAYDTIPGNQTFPNPRMRRDAFYNEPSGLGQCGTNQSSSRRPGTPC